MVEIVDINYPENLDQAAVPSLPEDTPLSSSGDADRDHTELHDFANKAIVALERNAAQLTHDHSGYSTAAVTVTRDTLGVVPVNDLQVVTINGTPDGGTFTLSWDGHVTIAIADDATSNTIQSALEGLLGVNIGDVVVAGNVYGPFTIVFQNNLGYQSQPTLVADDSNLTGTDVSITVTHPVVGAVAVNEVQIVELQGSPTGGTFALGFMSFTTDDINYNDSDAVVQAALESFPVINDGNVSVVGDNGGPYTITFINALAGAPQVMITATNALTGGLFNTRKLLQVNTHEEPDTDIAVTSIHHTIDPTRSSPVKAAAANHWHSYNELHDRPYIICTTTTRPTEPFIGLRIWETDTNTERVWAKFPTNPQATGVTYSDNFNRAPGDDLASTIWELHYAFGDTLHGVFTIVNIPGTLYVYSAWWSGLLTSSNHVLCQRINEAERHTLTDDQEIECHWGIRPFDVDRTFDGDESHDPCNDHYFRLSDDRSSYVRVSIHRHYIVAVYTTNGIDNEVTFGNIIIEDWEPTIIWRVRALGWGFYVYRNGVHVGTLTDNLHRHNIGANYRGWGFGTHVVGWPGGQYRAPDISWCGVKDNTDYAAVARWGLLPTASIPVFIAEASSRLEIPGPYIETAVVWGNILQEWIYAPFWSDQAESDITITEPGVYHVHASIAWDPGFYFADHAMISVKCNGQDISRKHWEFLRGYTYAPGFAQTQEINFWYRFEAGDKLRVVAKHNGSGIMYTQYNLDDPDRQVCYVEAAFHSP